MENVYIVAAARTPIGGFNGALAMSSAPKLGAAAIKEALNRSGLKPEDIAEVIMGNVISCGIGQAPARQAAIYSGLPPSVGALTVNKVCGSGLKAVTLGYQMIRAGDAKAMVSGGMENMSQAPYLLEKARTGYRFGHGQLIDANIKDGLWDPYDNIHMGNCAEACAEKHEVTREAQDEFAISSYKKAQEAQAKGSFKDEIVPVDGINEDEEPKKSNFDKFPKLKPVFKANGTVTPANASKLNDGGAAVVLASESMVKERNLKPLAKILGWAQHSQEPIWFTTAPAGALQNLSKKTGMGLDEFDLFEINEAFAVVSLACMKLLNLPQEKINVNGGAVALGHPIGASGTRILVTLINALKQRNLKRGAAAICLGGGEAVSVGIEILN
ncbi:MAG: thiolase family protein [Elusimicrobia bacterium]|nr:thiolase family protein [Elusimicrobiota bacterium]